MRSARHGGASSSSSYGPTKNTAHAYSTSLSRAPRFAPSPPADRPSPPKKPRYRPFTQSQRRFCLVFLVVLGVLGFCIYATKYSAPSYSLYSSFPSISSSRKSISVPYRHPRSLDAILNQPSSLVSPLGDPVSLSAVIFFDLLASKAALADVLSHLSSQTFPPSSVVILHPTAESVDVNKVVNSFSSVTFGMILRSFHHSEFSLSAALFHAVSEAGTDLVYIIDLDKYQRVQFNTEITELFARIASSSSYSSSIITAGGVFWGSESSRECIAASSLEHAAPVHIPFSPLVVRSSWLTPHLAFAINPHITSPLANLAYVLTRHAGISSIAAPLLYHSNLTSSSRPRDYIYDKDLELWSTQSCRSVFDDMDVNVRNMLSGDLNQLLPGTDFGSNFESTGSVNFLLSNVTEVNSISKIACRSFAINDVHVLILTTDDHFLSKSIHVGDCGLEARVISLSTLVQSPNNLLNAGNTIATQLMRNTNPAAWIYIAGGSAEVWIEAALRRLGAAFASDTNAANEYIRDPVPAIRLPPSDIPHAEWIGALPSAALRSWHKPRVDLAVVTNDRSPSLKRLLKSAKDAVYFGDSKVSLTINMEQSADKKTKDFSNSFRWPHGTYNVRHRVVLGTLLPAIMESWYPSSNHSYGVLLEDDVELSPLYYGWLKYSVLYYRYYEPVRRQARRLFGVSFYQQRALEYLPAGRKPFNVSLTFQDVSIPEHIPYLTPVPCSWGAVYFPEIWREFHDYIALRLSQMSMNITNPIVPNSRSNRWPRSWKKYLVELVYLRGYTMLYPNYPQSSSFSTNHLEIGDHVKDLEAALKRKELFEVPIRERTKNILEDLPRSSLPDWKQLPVVDLWGNLSTEKDLITRGHDTFRKMEHHCRTIPATMVDSRIPPSFLAKELLCRNPKFNSLKKKKKKINDNPTIASSQHLPPITLSRAT